MQNVLMEYLSFDATDYSVWQRTAIQELKEKSFDETLRWVVDENIVIDAYADSYLASPTELLQIQKAQQKSTKCILYVPSAITEQLGTGEFATYVITTKENNTLKALVSFLHGINDYLKQNAAENKELSFEILIPLPTNYLLTIAQLRAVRYLTTRLIQSYGRSTHVSIRGVTDASFFKRDNEHINLVRATTMVMAGIVGGCNYIEIVPFDLKQNDFSTRLAKNVMHLLDEEAYLNEVADPSAGSYFIENLTYKLIQQTWITFLAESVAK